MWSNQNTVVENTFFVSKLKKQKKKKNHKLECKCGIFGKDKQTWNMRAETFSAFLFTDTHKNDGRRKI